MPSVVSSWYAANFPNATGTNPDGTPFFVEQKVIQGYIGTRGSIPKKPTQPKFGAPADAWSKYNWDLATWNAKTNNGQNYDVRTGLANSASVFAESQKKAQEQQALVAANQQAMQRIALRQRLQIAQQAQNLTPVFDSSPLDVAKDAKPGAPVRGGMTTSSTVPGSAAWNFDSNTPLQALVLNPKTGQFEPQYQTTIQYGNPRNKWEVGNDTGPVIGRTQTPVITHAQYQGDTARAAQGYAANNKMTPAQIRDWQSFFVGMHIVGGPATLTPGQFVSGVWDQATQQAMDDLMGYSNRTNGVTVDQARSMFENSWANGNGGVNPAALAAQAVRSGQPRHTVSKVYSITSVAQGSQLIRSYLQQQLGRDPNSGEVAAYVRLLNGQERKNPQITTTNYSATGASSTSVQQGANVDPQAAADQFVKANLGPENAGRKGIEMFNWLGGV